MTVNKPRQAAPSGARPVRQPAKSGLRCEEPMINLICYPGVSAGQLNEGNVVNAGQGPLVADLQAPTASGECDQMSVLSTLSATLAQLATSLSKVAPKRFGVDDSATAASVWATELHTVTERAHSVKETAVTSPTQLQSTHVSHRVPDCFRKETMPCILSPLGFHLSNGTKDKIWNGDFIDILSLLPSQKEYYSRIDKEKIDDDKKQPVARTFNNWLQAFMINASIMCERFPELQHIDVILEAYRNFGGLACFFYDKSFRQKLAVHPSIQWGQKVVGLWLKLFVPQKPTAPCLNNMLPSASNGSYRKGICFAFNDAQCKFL